MSNNWLQPWLVRQVARYKERIHCNTHCNTHCSTQCSPCLMGHNAGLWDDLTSQECTWTSSLNKQKLGESSFCLKPVEQTLYSASVHFKKRRVKSALEPPVSYKFTATHTATHKAAHTLPSQECTWTSTLVQIHCNTHCNTQSSTHFDESRVHLNLHSRTNSHRLARYRVAQSHRMPYLYRSFSAKEPYS